MPTEHAIMIAGLSSAWCWIARRWYVIPGVATGMYLLANVLHMAVPLRGLWLSAARLPADFVVLARLVVVLGGVGLVAGAVACVCAIACLARR